MDDIKNALQKQKEDNKALWRELADLHNQFAALKNFTETNFSILFHAAGNFAYEVCDAKFRENVWHPKIMSIADTVDEIVEHKKSIARFGDGEFGIMCGVQRWRFQKKDELLAERLKEVVQSQNDKILIGLIDFYGDLRSWERGANGARIYLTPEVRKQHYALLNRDRLYANTSISRNETWEGVRNQKRIWEGRDCVFIEGFQTRMGVGNDLFDNAKSIVRILCPAESAFDRYEEIYREAVKQPKDRLVLLALGPTASVLAYDLTLQGYQAVDIGHADLSYEVLLKGKSNLFDTDVPNKYNNEAPTGYLVEEIYDAVYESQIIADFH